MIYLDSITNIQMDLSGAVSSIEPECHVSYRDEFAQIAETSPFGYRPTRGTTQRSVTSGTTDVIICAVAPSSNVIRAVQSIVFNNRDTATVTVRIWTDDGTNERELWGPRALLTGEVLFYEDGSGWGVS